MGRSGKALAKAWQNDRREEAVYKRLHSALRAQSEAVRDIAKGCGKGCGKGGKANGKAKSRSSCAGLQFPGGGYRGYRAA